MTLKEMSIFPAGKPNDAYAEYFIGQSYLNMLSTEQVSIGNVTFEPGCRNNWHIHHADKGGGQILMVTAGRGYYQEWGKEAPDSWFQHLAIEAPGDNCRNEWCEPVSDEEYEKLRGV